MTQLHIYRGVTFTKTTDEKTPVKKMLRAKVYRGAQYFKLAKAKNVGTDHVYRGSHYLA